MATLQRFKLLATQCATAAGRSPNRSPPSASPAKSPSFHLRRHRRRTLRRLLSRGSSCRDQPSESTPAPDRGEKKSLLSHTSLKDLFVSSPSPPPPLESNGRGGGGVDVGGAEGGEDADADGVWNRLQAPAGSRVLGWRLGFEGFGARRGSGGGVSSRLRSGVVLRYRLLRRAWRPVLVTIPE